MLSSCLRVLTKPQTALMEVGDERHPKEGLSFVLRENHTSSLEDLLKKGNALPHPLALRSIAHFDPKTEAIRADAAGQGQPTRSLCKTHSACTPHLSLYKLSYSTHTEMPIAVYPSIKDSNGLQLFPQGSPSAHDISLLFKGQAPQTAYLLTNVRNPEIHLQVVGAPRTISFIQAKALNSDESATPSYFYSIIPPNLNSSPLQAHSLIDTSLERAPS